MDIDADSLSIKKPKSRKCLIIACLLMLSAVAAIFIAGGLIGEKELAADFSRKSLAPSLQHPFGTDWLGRDMLMRVIKGLALSVQVGAAASAVSAVIAALVGALAAVGSKKLDAAVNWIIDLVMSLPHIVLLILISFALGGGKTGLLVGISITHWTSLARLIRAEVIQIRSRDYIKISRSLGHSPLWILVHHILPHIIPQLLVGLILIFPHAILHESALSFLGYGMPPEQPAIGIILSEGMRYLSGGMWWIFLFPGAMLAAVVILFDKLGELLKRLAEDY